VRLGLLINFNVTVLKNGIRRLANELRTEDGALVLGATGGYLVGFLLAAGVVGRLAELGWDRKIGGSLAAMVIGNIVIYLVGVPWLMGAVGFPLARAPEVGLLPFLVGDALKLAVAAGLLPVGWWLVRRRSNDL
jgi:biotin transport system substrate-specific component